MREKTYKIEKTVNDQLEMPPTLNSHGQWLTGDPSLPPSNKALPASDSSHS